MHWVTTPDASLPEMLRITTRASKELRAIPGVRNFGAHIGQAFAADEVVGVNFGENWISISRDADYDKTHARIEEMVEGYPGLYRDVQTYLKERIREVLTGAGEAIVVRIFGPDLDVLRDKAEEVRAALADVPDLVNLHKELMVEVPHIQVTVKLEEAQRYGLKPGDVRRASATFMAGEEVGDIFLGGRTYDVQVWTAPESRHSVDSVREILSMHPDRIRHGIRATEDASLLAEIVDRGLVLDVCLTSNMRTGVVTSLAEHPIGLLRRLRFRVTVNTDNRLMSDTTLTGEFAGLVEALDFGWDDVEWLTINAMKSSFLHFEGRLRVINGLIKPGFATLRTEAEETQARLELDREAHRQAHLHDDRRGDVRKDGA